MKKRVIAAVAAVVAIAIIVTAVILISKGNNAPKATEDSAQPWSVAYFTEMRSMYGKIESKELTDEEEAYNGLVDELNDILDKYQKAAESGLSADEHEEYEKQVQAKLKEIETAYKSLKNPPMGRDDLLEKVYELDAEIREANADNSSAELSDLSEKASILKQKLTKSEIDLDEATLLYDEYSEELTKLTAKQQK